jgi:small-conductance mechanosensitive channel
MSYEPLLIDALFLTIAIFLTLMAGRIVNKLCSLFYIKVAKKTKTTFDDEFLPLVRRILNIGIWVFFIFVISAWFNVNIMGIYAGLGIGSLITVIFVREGITNIISGITIMIDRPFRAGDTIKLPSGDFGIVLDIGLRRTKMSILDEVKRDGPKSILVIANKEVSKCKVYNYTYLKEYLDKEHEKEKEKSD